MEQNRDQFESIRERRHTQFHQLPANWPPIRSTGEHREYHSQSRAGEHVVQVSACKVTWQAQLRSANRRLI